MTRIYFALSNVSGSFQLSWWDGVSTPFDTDNGRFSVRKYIPIGTDEIWIGIKLLNGNIDKPYSQILGFRSSDGNVPNIVTTFYAVSMSKKVSDLEGLCKQSALQMRSSPLKVKHSHGREDCPPYILMAHCRNLMYYPIQDKGRTIFIAGLPERIMEKLQCPMARLQLFVMMARLK